MQDPSNSVAPEGAADAPHVPNFSPKEFLEAPSPDSFSPTGPVDHLALYELILSLIVVAAGGMVAFAITRMVANNYAGLEQGVRGVLIVTVIIGSLLLITAGYSVEQLAPVMGLFGTIAGYLLKGGASKREKS